MTQSATDAPARVPAGTRPVVVFRALVDVGASDDIARILTCVSLLHTGGRVGYRLEGHGVGDVSGAWAVSTDVWGKVPSELPGQAAQALRIYDEQIRTLPWTDETLPERCCVSNIAWFTPQVIRSQMPIDPVSPVLLGKVRAILSQLGPAKPSPAFPWLPVIVLAGIAVVLYFFG